MKEVFYMLLGAIFGSLSGWFIRPFAEKHYYQPKLKIDVSIMPEPVRKGRDGKWYLIIPIEIKISNISQYVANSPEIKIIDKKNNKSNKKSLIDHSSIITNQKPVSTEHIFKYPYDKQTDITKDLKKEILNNIEILLAYKNESGQLFYTHYQYPDKMKYRRKKPKQFQNFKFGNTSPTKHNTSSGSFRSTPL